MPVLAGVLPLHQDEDKHKAPAPPPLCPLSLLTPSPFCNKMNSTWELVAIVTPLSSTKHNCSGTLVLEMITRLVASHNHNLLWLAFNFAALVYDKPDEHAWLIERFEMYKKDLEESYIYQRILGEGRKEGREEGRTEGQRESLRETLVGFLNARYPMLVDLAREQISGITEIKRLQEILNRVFYLQTAGEIEEYLLSLHDDATKN